MRLAHLSFAEVESNSGGCGAPGMSTSETGRKQTGWSFVPTDHLGLIATFAAATFAGIRLMAAANMNPVSATAILQNIGVANAVVGTLLAVLPFLPLVVLLVALERWLQIRLPASQLHRQREKSILESVMIGVAITAFFITPWQALAFVLGLVLIGLALVAILIWREDRSSVAPLEHPTQPGGTPRMGRPARRRVSRGVQRVNWLAVLVVGMFAIQPWFAPELIRTDDGTMVGFVLRDEGDRTVILRQEDRAVLYVSGPVSRTICHDSIAFVDGRPLATFLFRSPEPYQPCPDE